MPQLTMARPRAARPRRGFTLIEVLITKTILAIVGATVTNILTRQQRFYRDAAETTVVRRELRGGATLVPADLRAVSTVGHDLMEATATSFTVRAAIGSAVVCNITAGRQELDLVPLALSNHTLTAWYSAPQQNDTLFIFNEGPETGAEDDSWVQRWVAAAPTSDAALCPGTPYVAAADAALPKVRLSVGGGTVPTEVTVGTVVRITRPMRYSFYQPSGTSDWYLGFQEHGVGAWGGIQPIAGPLAPGGLRFSYFNPSGVPRTPTTQLVRDSISRIHVAIRATGRTDALRKRGGAAYQDSLLFNVGIRNFR